MRSVRSHATGDLICTVVIETPVKLDKKQRELLREFGATLDGDGARHHPETASWLGKARKFFGGPGEE